MQVMELLGEEEVGDAGKHGGEPAEGGDEGGPAQVGEGQQVERVADRQVALRGEREDCEDARIGSAVGRGSFGCFVHKSSHLSERKLLKLQKTLPKGQGY